MKYLYQLFFTLLLPCMAFAQGSQTVSITPAKDNTLFQEQENSNGLGANFFAGNTNIGVGNARRGLLYFQLNGVIPAGSTITSVSLQLYCNKVPSSSPVTDMKLHKLLAAWGEGTTDAGEDFDGNGLPATADDATWLQRIFGTSSWTTPGGDYTPAASASTPVSGANAYYTWSSAQLITDVQGWVNTPASNNGWIVIGDETIARTAKRFASKNNTNTQLQPQLTITYLGPVPVTLTNFAAKEAAGGITLNWQTQQELNNAWFDVQYSTDGVRFSNIGRVSGAGNSTTVKNYNFLHTGTAPGNHFYRLAQTDFDGKINYSTVVQLSTKKGYYTISISPNPVASSIQLSGSAYQKGSAYTVFSQNGTAVLQGKLQSPTINTASLAAGTYILQVEQPGGKALHGRFVKQ
jgi:hypothetical protein